MKNNLIILTFTALLLACSNKDADVARARAEADKAQAEAEKAKAEAVKAQAEAEKAKTLAAAAAAAADRAPPSKSAPPPARTAGASSAATISISVASQKSNGKAWDAAGGAPDIAVCITSSSGTSCSPNGSNIGSVTQPACRDAFQCTVTMDAPAGEFSIDVLDVDLAVNDTIGSGSCARGRTCSIGQATVTVN